jgi:hypothetical protein
MGRHSANVFVPKTGVHGKGEGAFSPMALVGRYYVFAPSPRENFALPYDEFGRPCVVFIFKPITSDECYLSFFIISSVPKIIGLTLIVFCQKTTYHNR